MPRPVDVGGRGHVARDRAQPLEEMIDVFLVLAAHPLAHHVLQRVAVVPPRRSGGEAGIVDQVRAAEQIAHAGPGLGRDARLESGRDPAVARLHQLARRLLGIRALPRRLDARVDLRDRRRLLDREVDLLPLTRPIALPERRHDRAEGRPAGVVERGIAAHLERLSPRRADGEEQAAERLGDDLVREVVPIRAVLPERGDRRQDEAGVERRQCGIRQVPPGERSGRIALDDHVRLGHQAPEHRLAGGPRQVERDALLRGVQVEKRRAALGVRGVPREWGQGPSGIAFRGLDLDDARAQARQELAAVGARDSLAQLEDGDVAENARRCTTSRPGIEHGRTSSTIGRSRVLGNRRGRWRRPLARASESCEAFRVARDRGNWVDRTRAQGDCEKDDDARVQLS